MANDWSDAGGAPQGWWGASGASLGAVADIYSFIQNLQARQQQQKLYDIMSNPQKLAAYVGKFFQPMGSAENAAVQRDLGSNWATMTGGAPGGAMSQFVADALAKIESQRYQSATGSALQSLGQAGGQIPGQQPIGAFGNILRNLAILKQIQGQGQQQKPGLADLPGSISPELTQSPYQVPSTVPAVPEIPT